MSGRQPSTESASPRLASTRQRTHSGATSVPPSVANRSFATTTRTAASLLSGRGMKLRRRGCATPEAAASEVWERLKTSHVAEALRLRSLHNHRVMRTDSLRRKMDLYLSTLACLSILLVFVQSIVVWTYGTGYAEYSGVRIPVENSDSGTLFWFVTVVQTVLVLLNIACIVCIGVYYHSRLEAKRIEWGQDLLKTAVSSADAEEVDQQAAQAYGFLSSSLFPKFVLETLIYLVFPYPWLTTNYPTFYHFAQVAVYCRVYVLFRFLHTNSAAFQKRLRIRQFYSEFKFINLNIDWALSLKIIFYEHPVKMTALCCLVAMMLAAIALHTLERKHPTPDQPEYGDISNCLWFAFVTFTTIGYGDMTPKTHAGKLVTLTLGFVSQLLLAVFGGVVTNKLAPSKQQQLITAYLKSQKGEGALRIAAATLIQSVWRASRYGGSFGQHGSPRTDSGKEAQAKSGDMFASSVAGRLAGVARRAQDLPLSMLRELQEHKRNRLYKAVKEFRKRRSELAEAQLRAGDPVVDVKLDQIVEAIEDMSVVMSDVARRMQDLSSRQDEYDWQSPDGGNKRRFTFTGLASLARPMQRRSVCGSLGRRASAAHPRCRADKRLPPAPPDCESTMVMPGVSPRSTVVLADDDADSENATLMLSRYSDADRRRRGVSFVDPSPSDEARRPPPQRHRTLSPPGSPAQSALRRSARGGRAVSASVFTGAYLSTLAGAASTSRTSTPSESAACATGRPTISPLLARDVSSESEEGLDGTAARPADVLRAAGGSEGSRQTPRLLSQPARSPRRVAASAPLVVPALFVPELDDGIEVDSSDPTPRGPQTASLSLSPDAEARSLSYSSARRDASRAGGDDELPVRPSRPSLRHSFRVRPPPPPLPQLHAPARLTPPRRQHPAERPPTRLPWTGSVLNRPSSPRHRFGQGPGNELT